MANYRSNLNSDSDMQIEPYNSTPSSAVTPYYETPQKLKEGKGSAVSKSWSFSDPEMQRKKRVVSYKAYTVQAKLKGSFTRCFRWIKDLLSH
ncbi:hypothetical protein AAHA92_04855 [Salvia divinorum]|uniref:Uncharacterized protein n=1 Tax=Salvia divinorum TaxID=28513 RepID=A0ABD1I0K8_SALDI